MTRVLTAGLVVLLVSTALAQQSASRLAAVSTSGELRQWHKITLTLDGPDISETANSPNPFLDFRLSATFVHETGAPAYTIPGYFAGDGDAANSSATSGNKWRIHFAPDKTGRWDWHISFVAACKCSRPTRREPTFGHAGGWNMSGSAISDSPHRESTS
jgi:hypothetical protein